MVRVRGNEGVDIRPWKGLRRSLGRGHERYTVLVVPKGRVLIKHT
jgi:hypothetical protein